MSKPDPDAPPPYEDSEHVVRQLDQSLWQRRHQLFQPLLNQPLEQCFQSQVRAGLLRSTAVLIPSDSRAAAEEEPADDATKAPASSVPVAVPIPASEATAQDLLPSDDTIVLLQLRGTDYAVPFWRQAGTATALAADLRSHLRNDGHFVEDEVSVASLTTASRGAASPDAASPGVASPIPSSPPPPRRRGFFGRMRSAVADAAAGVPDPGVGVLHRNVPVRVVPRPGWVRVEVEVRDVALRVCSAMGLWGTRSGVAVVVRMEIGGSEDESRGAVGWAGKR